MPMTTRAYVTAGILIAFAATAIPAQAAFVPIATCNPASPAPAGSLINASGDYEVVSDLFATPVYPACIVITASGVSLKLNGHQITSVPGAVANDGIDVGAAGAPIDHVAIEGPGLVHGLTNGISIVAASYVQVDLVTVANNLVFGITASTVQFISMGSNVLVKNGQVGLTVSNSVGGTIQFNQAISNATTIAVPGSGIVLQGGSANTLNNNVASGNGVVLALNSGGIVLISETSDRLTGDTTNGNAGDGIVILGGGGNQIFNNPSSVGNGAFDMEDFNPFCGTDNWSGNTFFTANPSTCIH